MLVHLRNCKSEQYMTIRTTCLHPTKPLKIAGKNTVRACTTTSYSQTHQSFKNFSQMAIMKRNHHSCMVKYSKPCLGWRMENHLAQVVFRQNCWRLVEQQFYQALFDIWSKIWDSKFWSELWTQSIIICLFKKGDRSRCENYRTISLINHSSKILLNTICQQLKPHLCRFLSQEQARFQEHRSTVEQIFTLWQLAEKHVERQNNESNTSLHWL